MRLDHVTRQYRITPIRIRGITAEIPRSWWYWRNAGSAVLNGLHGQHDDRTQNEVALIRRLKPLFKPLRSSSVHCQVLMTASGAKSPLRM